MSFDNMKLPELKAQAKAWGIKGYSTMRKPEILQALADHEASLATEAEQGYNPAEVNSQPTSGVAGILASMKSFADAKSRKGRAAGQRAKIIAPMSRFDREQIYRLQRGSDTATLTARQQRRLRKADAKLQKI